MLDLLRPSSQKFNVHTVIYLQRFLLTVCSSK